MTAALAILAGAAVLLAWLHLETYLLGPAPRNALRVLMYHRIGSPAARDTVTPETLERQIAWLLAEGYHLVSFSQVVAHRDSGAPLPPLPVLLTFDDGTLDQHERLLPIVRKLGAPAGLFAVSGLVGREVVYDGRTTRFADASMLRELAAAGVQIGLHSHSHVDLRALSPTEVEEEMARSFRFFAENEVPVQPVLAYPFGAYAREPREAREAFFAALERSGIRLAFRIGNRVNDLPLPTTYEVQRTSIRGTDRPWAFRVKVRKGRRKAFA